MNNATQNQKYLVAGVAAVAGMYMSYLYGQKNPGRNVLDVPPKEMGQHIKDRYDDKKQQVQERIDSNKK